MRALSHTDAKVFAELVERSLDTIVVGYPQNGSMHVKTVGGERYWYYAGYDRGGVLDGTGKYEKFVGRVEDPQVEQTVRRFSAAKVSYLERRKAASLLRRSGLPSPTRQEGAIVEALTQAGVFSTGAILVGTLAFQTFPGLVGARFGSAGLQTADIDVARERRRIPILGEVSAVGVEDALKAVDPSFRPLFNPNHPGHALGYENDASFRIEFLTDARSRSGSSPVHLEGMDGVSAQPLTFLEYLLEEPVNSVLLHEAGILVLVPDPHRYAVHKLIVSTMRRGDPIGVVKSRKDLLQTGEIVKAVTMTAPSEGLGLAWIDAYGRGPSWRRHLMSGLAGLDPDAKAPLGASVRLAADLAGIGSDVGLQAWPDLDDRRSGNSTRTPRP